MMGCGKLLLRFDKMKLSKKDSFCLRLHLKSFTYYRQKAEKSKGSPFSGKERLEGLNQNVSIWVFFIRVDARTCRHLYISAVILDGQGDWQGWTFLATK